MQASIESAMAGAFLPSFLSFFFLAGAGEKWEKKQQPSQPFFLLLFVAAASIGCSAVKEKVAVLNMCRHDLGIKIWRGDDTVASRQISIGAVNPVIFEIESGGDVIFEIEKATLNISGSDAEGRKQELSFPLFNGNTPERLRKEGLAHFRASDVSILKGDSLIQLVPVWTLHSFEDATFAVYLLYPDGSIYLTPAEHHYINLGKRKLDEGTDRYLDRPMKKKQKTKGIENWKVGVRNIADDTIKVEILSDHNMIEETIKKNDDSLHIFNVKYNVHNGNSGCNEEVIDDQITIYILDNGRAMVEANFYIFGGYSIRKMKAMTSVPHPEDAKGNDEYIFVWTIEAIYAHLEIQRLDSSGKSIEIYKKLYKEDIVWCPLDSDED